MALTYSFVWDKAELLWKTNLKQNPSFLANYLSLSRIYFLLEERKALEKLYKDLVQNRKISKEKLYKLAENFYREGRAQEALSLMKKLEENQSHPSCPRESSCYLPASLWLGEYYLAEPNYKKAYYYYMRVLKRKARHPKALWALGKLAYLAKQWKQAIAYLKLLQKQKKVLLEAQRETYYLLANAYFQVGEISNALKESRKIPRNKHDYASLSLYGDILLIQNFQADLRSLLKLTNSKKTRRSLLRHWYGVEQIKGLREIHSSFFL